MEYRFHKREKEQKRLDRVKIVKDECPTKEKKSNEFRAFKNITSPSASCKKWYIFVETNSIKSRKS